MSSAGLELSLSAPRLTTHSPCPVRKGKQIPRTSVPSIDLCISRAQALSRERALACTNTRTSLIKIRKVEKCAKHMIRAWTLEGRPFVLPKILPCRNPKRPSIHQDTKEAPKKFMLLNSRELSVNVVLDRSEKSMFVCEPRTS